MGHHHRISGVYLVRYAREASWKEDHRRDSNGLQVRAVIVLVTRTGPSVDFCGYCILNCCFSWISSVTILCIRATR
jgi:hypothetical protein